MQLPTGNDSVNTLKLLFGVCHNYLGRALNACGGIVTEEVGHVIDLFIKGTFLMTSVDVVVLIRKL